MAKTDWAQLNAEFLQEHEATGISAKDWCDSRGLNYNSARRYLKSRGNLPSPIKISRSCAICAFGSAQTAQSAQSAQAEGMRPRPKGRAKRGEVLRIHSHPADSALNPKTNGRDSSGRFTEGNPGNPNPVTRWKPGDRPALTHGGYAKFLDAEELFDQARELQLRDELDFTRARVISVTKLLRGCSRTWSPPPR